MFNDNDNDSSSGRHSSTPHSSLMITMIIIRRGINVIIINSINDDSSNR